MPAPIFISDASVDRVFAARLANDLRALHVPVWWDEWEIKVGDSIRQKILKGIEGAANLCLVLSKTSVGSDWVQFELEHGGVREMELRKIFVLPLLLEDCQVPFELRGKKYANFANSYDDGFEALLRTVAPLLDPDILRDLRTDDPQKSASAVARIPPEKKALYVRVMREQFYSEDATEGAALRLAALSALYYLRISAIAPMALAAAKDESAAVRRQAAVFISELRMPACRTALYELREDSSQSVREVAKSAIKRLGL